MSSTSRFSSLPQINIGRSRWNMNFDHPTSWEHGRIVPLACIRYMPGDSFKLNLASLIRMSQPIVPIMDNIRCNIYAFSVPQRLLWEHQKEFCGENTTGAGPQLNQFYIPAANFDEITSNVYGSGVSFNGRPVVGSVSHYLHKPLADGSEDLYGSDHIKVSVLKERAYWLVYNEFFRPQQFVQPISLYKDDTEKIGIMSNNTAVYTQGSASDRYIDFHTKCAITSKQFDYFTSGTLSPQYGPSVEIPLGDYAPLGFLYDDTGAAEYGTLDAFTPGQGWNRPIDENVFFGTSAHTSQDNVSTLVNGQDGALLQDTDSGLASSSVAIADSEFQTNLVANLSNATAASINTLRAAFATQRFLERNNYGTRYHEYIQVHFGVKPPLGLLQVPELIGEHHFNINVQQVLSTAGAADDTTTKLGQPGANSVTGDKCMLFKKSFVEHGYLLIVMTTTHDRHYTSGILRDDLKRELLEFYHPEFATLGDQATKRLEIQFRNNSNNDYSINDAFGYQEHWAEYRYVPSQASGLLDPNAANGLSMWTLTNTYDEEVQLDEGFLLEDRSALANALVTGVSGPDYIGDFYFNFDVVRPMPLYSIPGRIDHVGNW